MSAKSFEIEGYAEQMKKLKSMMTEDPTFRHRINAVVRQVLKEARKEISEDAMSVIGNDPRHAYKAVRSSVYRRILGGQVNILARKKAGAPTSYQKPRKGLPKIGGNRWGRSDRTIALEGYEGMDRGFILRFFNAGTHVRAVRTYKGKDGEKHSINPEAKKGGHRGSMDKREFFGNSSMRALEKASQQMQELIDRVIAQEFV